MFIFVSGILNKLKVIKMKANKMKALLGSVAFSCLFATVSQVKAMEDVTKQDKSAIGSKMKTYEDTGPLEKTKPNDILSTIIKGGVLVGDICQSLIGILNMSQPAQSLIPGVPSLLFEINKGQAGALNIDQQSAICFTIPTAPGVTVQYIAGCDEQTRWVPVNELFQVPAETRLDANNTNSVDIVNVGKSAVINLAFRGLKFNKVAGIGNFNLTIKNNTTLLITCTSGIVMTGMALTYFNCESDKKRSITNSNTYPGTPQTLLDASSYMFNNIPSLGFNTDADVLDGSLAIEIISGSEFDLNSLSKTRSAPIPEDLLSKYRQIDFKK
jgi:hypothetical protein